MPRFLSTPAKKKVSPYTRPPALGKKSSLCPATPPPNRKKPARPRTAHLSGFQRQDQRLCFCLLQLIWSNRPLSGWPGRGFRARRTRAAGHQIPCKAVFLYIRRIFPFSSDATRKKRPAPQPSVGCGAGRFGLSQGVFVQTPTLPLFTPASAWPRESQSITRRIWLSQKSHSCAPGASHQVRS